MIPLTSGWPSSNVEPSKPAEGTFEKRGLMQDRVDTPPRPRLSTLARIRLAVKLLTLAGLIRFAALPDVFGSWAWIPGLFVLPVAFMAWDRAERSGGKS